MNRKMSYEEALEKLKEIVTRLESGRRRWTVPEAV